MQKQIQAFSNTQIPLRKIQIQIHKYVSDPVPGGWTWWVDVVGGDVRWKWWVDMVGDMMGGHGGWT